MGSSISKLFSSLFKQKKMRLIMIGLDAVGKTTILYRLTQQHQQKATIPTIGFNMEAIKYKNIEFTCFDIGGGDQIRKLWKQYLDTDNTAIIFVIDLSDPQRLPNAKSELMTFLNEKETKNFPLLIYANKQDISQFTIDYLQNYLDLPNHSRQYYIQSCSALTGQGIFDGLLWLSKTSITKL